MAKNDLMKVIMKDGKKLQKKLQTLDGGGEKAIQRTVSDFKSRAPGWVSKGVRQHYGIQASGMKAHAPTIKEGTSTTVSGHQVDGATLQYESELLTPYRFSMKPKQAGKPGQISAEFTKGQRKNLPPQAFLASAKKKTGDDGPALPFQRRGSARYPLDIIKTVSVPQMLDNRARDEIENLIEKNLEKRFNNHVESVIKQAMK